MSAQGGVDQIEALMLVGNVHPALPRPAPGFQYVKARDAITNVSASSVLERAGARANLRES
jgi:hypothetical protein